VASDAIMLFANVLHVVEPRELSIKELCTFLTTPNGPWKYVRWNSFWNYQECKRGIILSWLW